MKIIIVLLFFTMLTGCSTTSQTTKDVFIDNLGNITPRIDEKSNTGFYKPSNLKECLDELEIMLNKEIKDSLKVFTFSEAFNKYKPILNWLKINWDISDSSQLSKYFHQFGFKEPDVIANGIFRMYWNFLNGKPLKIEIKPELYTIGKNLFLQPTDSLIIYNHKPSPFGTIIATDSVPEFIFIGRKFTLIDSLYDPMINFLKSNNFEPSDSLWYIWWPRVIKFGIDDGEFPFFLTEMEIEQRYKDGGSYNGDFILVVEDGNKHKMQWFMKNNKYDQEFIDYIKTKKHLLFYLIRKRDVYYFDY